MHAAKQGTYSQGGRKRVQGPHGDAKAALEARVQVAPRVAVCRMQALQKRAVSIEAMCGMWLCMGCGNTGCRCCKTGQF
eukprot:1147753-Pelagomonas_calceolata.AAC.11